MNELLYGILNILVYFAAAVSLLLPIRKFIHIYDELFRKMLHFVLLGSLAVWTVSFRTWWIEVLSVIGFVAVVYPVLIFFEKFKAYSETVAVRESNTIGFEGQILVLNALKPLAIFVYYLRSLPFYAKNLLLQNCKAPLRTEILCEFW